MYGELCCARNLHDLLICPMGCARKLAKSRGPRGLRPQQLLGADCDDCEMSAVLCLQHLHVLRATRQEALGLRPQKHLNANVTSAAPASLSQSREDPWAATAISTRPNKTQRDAVARVRPLSCARQTRTR